MERRLLETEEELMVDTASRAPTPRPTPESNPPPARHPNRSDRPTPRVDVEKLGRQLLGTWADARLASRALSSRPEMQKVEGLSLEDQRARAFEQLKLLVANGQVHKAFPKSVGGQEDNGGNIAGFEELVAADPSLQIKSGVQWGLFGSAVMQLGTEYHHKKYLPGIMSLEVPGAFAMTETGHGSDVASVGTTATYDPETQEFVIDTPFRAAWKDYLGNAAKDGRAAVVFAQLITKGVTHGVHAFYVPIRDADGEFLPGIGGEDDGLKGGLNGIDNGRLHFTEVRIPRTDLLNKYGDVAEDGTYTSPIDSPGRRFFTMLGTLVQGRVSLDGVRRRRVEDRPQDRDHLRQRAPPVHGGQRHRRRGHPRLPAAPAAALPAARHDLRGELRARGVPAEVRRRLQRPRRHGCQDRQDLETIAAALKPLSTWHALDTLQECREACGGAGFLVENRLTSLRADLDVYVTFEGDNNVLLQLVAKRLLTDFSRKFAKADAGALARYVVTQAAGTCLPRHRPAQRGPDREGLRFDRALGQLAAGAEHPARAAHRPGGDHDRRDRRPAPQRRTSCRRRLRPTCSTRSRTS